MSLLPAGGCPAPRPRTPSTLSQGLSSPLVPSRDTALLPTVPPNRPQPRQRPTSCRHPGRLSPRGARSEPQRQPRTPIARPPARRGVLPPGQCSPRHGGALLFAELPTAPGQSDTVTNGLNQPVSAWEKSCNNFQLHTNIYSQVINSCKMLTDPSLQQR